MYIPTLKEFQAREERFEDIENLRIELLIKIEKEHNISGKIMDSLSYDVEFEETEKHSTPKAMYELIQYILKENYNIKI
jgi:hypothetical protein